MKHNSKKENARAGGQRAILKNKFRKYHTKPSYNQEKIALPKPVEVLAMLGIPVPTHKNHKCYFVIKCLFHNDGNPSLHFNSTNGHYRCFSCGAKGGLVNFYMKATGKAYADAINALKAWGA